VLPLQQVIEGAPGPDAGLVTYNVVPTTGSTVQITSTDGSGDDEGFNIVTVEIWSIKVPSHYLGGLGSSRFRFFSRRLFN
jgi:hypothetical protein